MPAVGNETELIAEAQQVLGHEEIVLSAGVFGLQDLTYDMVYGGIAGGVAAEMIGGEEVAAVGTLFGSLLAKKAAAEAQGVTLKLIVAVTAARIHVLNWNDSAGDRQVASFNRATATVKVKHFGLSRIVTIDDAASGAHMKLHASASPLTAQTGPDQDVLAALTQTV